MSAENEELAALRSATVKFLALTPSKGLDWFVNTQEGKEITNSHRKDDLNGSPIQMLSSGQVC